MLVLNSEARAETIFQNRLLKKYILRNHNRWYRYARETLGQDIKPEDLIVVSGWVKTDADWAAVAFSNTSTSYSASVEGHAAGVIGLELSHSRASSVAGPKRHRQGQNYSLKSLSSSPADSAHDQCAFLKRSMVRRRLGIVRKVVAGAGYYQPPGHDDDRSTAGGVGVIADEYEDDGEGAWQIVENEVSLGLWCLPKTADIPGTRAGLLTY